MTRLSSKVSQHRMQGLDLERGPVNRIGVLSLGLLGSYLLLSLALAWWSVMRAPTILERDDNPRLVGAEVKVQRGRILAVDNVVLAESIGSPDSLLRHYPIANAGPAVGYYSIRHGTSGIEAGYDAILRGEVDDFWSDFLNHKLLHQPQVGSDVRLTLESKWQRAADVILGDHNGAVLLLSLPETAIRAMVSHPGYDPNQLDERFDNLVADEDAPLLNRVTQGQYQPGMALQPLLMAAALSAGDIDLDGAMVVDDGEIIVNGAAISCSARPPVPATWSDILRLRCPSALTTLAQSLGKTGLDRTFSSFGLYRAPELPLEIGASGEQPVGDPLLAAIGQDNLTVTPLQMGLALVALANEGKLSRPRLVEAVQDSSGQWVPPVSRGSELPAASEEVVAGWATRAILETMTVPPGYAEHTALALSGPGRSSDAWYLGLAPAVEPRFVVVVVVEESEEVETARQVGRSLLRHVLTPPDK